MLPKLAALLSISPEMTIDRLVRNATLEPMLEIQTPSDLLRTPLHLDLALNESFKQTSDLALAGPKSSPLPLSTRISRKRNVSGLGQAPIDLPPDARHVAIQLL
jgi:hypothetical protein